MGGGAGTKDSIWNQFLIGSPALLIKVKYNSEKKHVSLV